MENLFRYGCFFSVLFMLAHAPDLYAQKWEVNIKEKKKINGRFNAALQFNGVFPGAGVSYDIPLLYIHKEKHKRNGKVVTRDITRGVRPLVGFYHHRHFHTNIWAGAGYFRRKTRPGGVSPSFPPGFPYQEHLSMKRPMRSVVRKSSLKACRDIPT